MMQGQRMRTTERPRQALGPAEKATCLNGDGMPLANRSGLNFKGSSQSRSMRAMM